MTPLEWLQARKDELAFSDTHKWVNHGPRDNKEMCIVAGGRNSINKRVHSLNTKAEISEILNEAIPKRIKEREVTYWNDNGKRKLPQVLDLFDRAILIAKERECR